MECSLQSGHRQWKNCLLQLDRGTSLTLLFTDTSIEVIMAIAAGETRGVGGDFRPGVVHTPTFLTLSQARNTRGGLCRDRLAAAPYFRDWIRHFPSELQTRVQDTHGAARVEYQIAVLAGAHTNLCNLI